MALKPCRECGQQVSTEANACPGCGVPNPTHRPRRPPPTAQDRRRALIGLGLVVLVVVAFGGYAVYQDSRSEADAEVKTVARAPHSADDAWSMCQRFVSRRLETPATAEFPSSYAERTVEHHGGGTYVVRSFVDHQNAFGATVRSRFVCMASHGEGGWVLDELAFL